MKKLLTSLVVSLLALSTVLGGTQSFSVGTVAANTTTKYISHVATLSREGNVALAVSGHAHVVGTNTSVVFTFDTSVDNSKWVTNAFSIQLNCLSTNVGTVTILNTNLAAIPYVRVGSVVNTNAASPVTNLVVKAFSKSGI